MYSVCVLSVLFAVSQAANLPWTLIQQAAARVSDEDNVLRFHAGVTPFQQAWNDFKDKHGKTYESEEELRRRDIFRENLKAVEMHNYLHAKGKTSFTMDTNEYSDMAHEEFVAIMNGYRNEPRNHTVHRGSTYLSPNVQFELPKSVDWREKGYVTPVKNQGQCGSCWSFSATGSLEGQHFRKNGELVSLSEQNLVDCSESYGNHGCNGGMMDYAFQYIEDNGGDDTEDSYPYEAREGRCRFKKADVGATDTGFSDIEQGSETQLQEAVATVGPISIAIDAAHPSFQQYQQGVYIEPECSPTRLDHGVLIVGYGTTEDGEDYWIVKNSWGPSWGNNGYIWMARNRNNQCGVASAASYPNV